jgi:hypothetical protein
MITALVHAEGQPEELAATLAALVHAIVEGLMGDAVIIAHEPDAAIKGIAEVAGATLAIVPQGVDPWRAGAARARREWLLCLSSGDVPGEGWLRAVDRFLAGPARSGQPLARFGRRQVLSLFTIGDLAARMTGTRSAQAGDLVRRDWLTAAEPARVRPARLRAAIERDIVLR